MGEFGSDNSRKGERTKERVEERDSNLCNRKVYPSSPLVFLDDTDNNDERINENENDDNDRNKSLTTRNPPQNRHQRNSSPSLSTLFEFHYVNGERKNDRISERISGFGLSPSWRVENIAQYFGVYVG